MTTFGLIGSNRNFFPDHLCQSGMQLIKNDLVNLGYKYISLNDNDTKFGCVETIDDARKCAALFAQHRDEIDGVIITLPNFGDERSAVDAIRWSGINVPILVHAFADEVDFMDNSNRRDSFCGKISICNNLYQNGIKFSLTKSHVVNPGCEEFSKDVHDFAAVCRVVKGMKSVRVGMIGVRPAAFNTVRFSEKILQRYGINVEPIDMYEVTARAQKTTVEDPVVKRKIDEINEYLPLEKINDLSIQKLAKLATVIDNWVDENQIDATAIQCWSSLEENYGIAPCLLMSMMSSSHKPSACETDVMGALSMYALMLASAKPSAIVDWNNNYGNQKDKCVVFHCSNFPRCMFCNNDRFNAKIGTHGILSQVLGPDVAQGVVEGRISPSPMTFCKVSTNEFNGSIKAYLGEGSTTNDPITTFGGYGVLEVKNLEKLLKTICTNGFEHHVAINQSSVVAPISEAFGNYLNYDVYLHGE